MKTPIKIFLFLFAFLLLCLVMSKLGEKYTIGAGQANIGTESIPDIPFSNSHFSAPKEGQ